MFWEYSKLVASVIVIGAFVLLRYFGKAPRGARSTGQRKVA
jgi:hypothetical protein